MAKGNALPGYGLLTARCCFAGEAAIPLTQSEFDELRKSGGLPGWDDWNYDPLGGDGSIPFEFHKRDDWGRLDGKLVAVDYANPAIHDPDEMEERMRNWQP